MAHDSIAVIDFGGQYAHLIATKVRCRGVLPEIELPTEVLDDLREEILDLPGVSSLALDITSKPPGTIEWE